MKTKTAMSKTAAIRTARQNVTIQPIGGQWQVNTYDESRRAWWQGIAQDWHKARIVYGAALIRESLAKMGKGEDEIWSAEYDYTSNGGNWTDYLPA